MSETRKTFLDYPSSERYDDEMSTLAVESEEIEVRDLGGRLIGEVAQIHVNGYGTSWAARDAYYAKWGDIPGRMMGWAGSFDTKEAAITALRFAVAQRQRSRAE